jgi:hypothetical protein
MIITQLLIYRAQNFVLHISRPDTQCFYIESIPIDPNAYSECMLAGDYADGICRVVPYFLQDGTGCYGTLNITVIFPYISKPYAPEI